VGRYGGGGEHSAGAGVELKRGMICTPKFFLRVLRVAQLLVPLLLLRCLKGKKKGRTASDATKQSNLYCPLCVFFSGWGRGTPH